MDETDVIITEAEPLAWKPPADNDQYQLLMHSYKDGRCYGLPAGWQVEQRPRNSPKVPYPHNHDKFCSHRLVLSFITLLTNFCQTQNRVIMKFF